MPFSLALEKAQLVLKSSKVSFLVVPTSLSPHHITVVWWLNITKVSSRYMAAKVPHSLSSLSTKDWNMCQMCPNHRPKSAQWGRLCYPVGQTSPNVTSSNPEAYHKSHSKASLVSYYPCTRFPVYSQGLFNIQYIPCAITIWKPLTFSEYFVFIIGGVESEIKCSWMMTKHEGKHRRVRWQQSSTMVAHPELEWIGSTVSHPQVDPQILGAVGDSDPQDRRATVSRYLYRLLRKTQTRGQACQFGWLFFLSPSTGWPDAPHLHNTTK